MLVSEFEAETLRKSYRLSTAVSAIKAFKAWTHSNQCFSIDQRLGTKAIATPSFTTDITHKAENTLQPYGLVNPNVFSELLYHRHLPTLPLCALQSTASMQCSIIGDSNR